jgi:hypothetical protein
MERHVEPLYLKSGIGWRKTPLRNEICDAKHLLETMEVVQRACEELLVDTMVPTRRQVAIQSLVFFLFRVHIKKRSITCEKFSAKA